MEKKQRKFLSAEWKYLIIANYVIDPVLLQQYIPANTEPDLWNGNCYVSLVGFLFHNTSVLGLKIPFHTNFEEINLRFYVKHFDNGNWKRGVVFIKEVVPRRMISFVANTFFNEQYITCATKNSLLYTEEDLSVEYKWRYRKKWNSLSVKAASVAEDIPQSSEAEFITEHYWGYSKSASGKTTEYAVEHPRWRIHPVKQYRINCDFKNLYGTHFAMLADTIPVSVFLAEGSAISVRNKRSL